MIEELSGGVTVSILAGVSDATLRQIEAATGWGTLSSLLAVLGALGLGLEVHG